MIVKFMGSTGDVTVCDCCGRADLKKTVALEVEGHIVYYGVVCASRALNRSAKEIKAETKRVDNERETARQHARQAELDAASDRWFTFLAANGTGNDNLTRIQSLGGYATARALFATQEVSCK